MQVGHKYAELCQGPKKGKSACLYAVNLKLERSSDMQTGMPSHLLCFKSSSQTIRLKARFLFDWIKIQAYKIFKYGENALNSKACSRNNHWQEKLTR